MVDSGASSLFIDTEFAREIGLELHKRPNAATLTLFDGSKGSKITHQTTVKFLFSKVEQTLTLDVTDLHELEMVLGLCWLRTYNPTVD